MKIFTNYNVVAMPQVGIYGAPMGNIFCFGLCLLLDLLLISRVVPRRPRYLPIFLKPLIASVIMGGAAWAVYGLGPGSSVPSPRGAARPSSAPPATLSASWRPSEWLLSSTWFWWSPCVPSPGMTCL